MVLVTKQLTPFLTLKTVQTDKFKTERLSVTLNDSPDRRMTPIARFVFSVLKRGCKKYPSQRELNVRLDNLYSASVAPAFFVGAGEYKLGFCAEMLGEEYSEKGVFEGTLELLFDILWNPLKDENGNFLPNYIERERENICDNIKSVVNNPRLYANKRFMEIMYEGDDYSIPTNGTVEMVNSITSQELTEKYNDLVSNSSYEIFYVGSKSSEEVEAIIKSFFDNNKFGKEKKADKSVDFACDTVKVKRVTEEMQLSQGKLVMGFKSGINITCGKDFYTMLVVNEIFGASPVSKLFMNVREKLGLCYYCSSRYDLHKGAIYVSSGIEKSDLKKTEAEILKQLKNIQKGKISANEFDAAKKSLVNLYTETTDSASAIERYYFLRGEFKVKDTIEEAIEKISETSLEDVIRVAGKLKLDTVYFLCGKEEIDCD